MRIILNKNFSLHVGGFGSSPSLVGYETFSKAIEEGLIFKYSAMIPSNHYKENSIVCPEYARFESDKLPANCLDRRCRKHFICE